MRFRALSLLSSLAFVAASHGGVARDGATPHGAVPRAASGVILGRVVVAGGQVPLSYSVVSIEALKVEKFTDANGRFVLLGVPAGRVVVRAKHIGYTPVDYPVTVPAGDTVRVLIELAKVAVQLPAITSVGNCLKPGAPKRDVDPALAVLFDQVRQNAERSRLLTRSYPFTYALVRVRTRQSSVDPQAPLDTEFVDTIRIGSTHDWRYKPGNMVIMAHDGRGLGQVLVLPELGDFADDAFIANHCFGYGGVESLDGRPMVRVDFAPADKIKEPDIGGIIYLDSATYQIRSAQIRLTKPSAELRTSLKTVSVDTRYTEVSPGIPMMSSYTSLTELSDAERRVGWAASMTAEQLISVHWINGQP